MFSRFFIDRPIFATVLAVLMILVGVLTIKTLPVAQYPDITPPTVSVTAVYPGADAATVATAIGQPIEEQVNGVDGMMYMSSSSGSDGSYNLTITFEIGTDIDQAAVKVQNRVSQAEATLPSAVRQQGVSVLTRSSNIVMFVGLKADSAYAKTYDALYLTNYANINLVDALARLDGVGEVGTFGAGNYSMRVWLNPEKMRVRGLTPSDVTAAIQSQNLQVSAGQAGAPPQDSDQPFEFTITSQGRLVTPEQFGNIVLRARDNGELLHLKDVAEVTLGSQNYSQMAKVNGKPTGLIAIYQTPGANALDVAERVTAKLDDLQRYFPEGVHYNVIMNTTEVVSASIDEVLVTFVETTLIVMVVILLFLQSWRAVIIPMLTIPVSLIATFAVMKVMGFTINTLTLFGLVLAIAIVVDDAIVVVEDCARIVDKGKMTPRQAAVKAMQELEGPVIGEVLVLLSVFIPTAFISGITGELYKQFALTIAVSTAFSGFNALTFTPAMCALFLRPTKPGKSFIYRWFDKGFNATLAGYMKVVGTFLRRPVVAIAAYFLICGVAFWGFVKMPTSYLPAEDQGYFLASVQLPTGATVARTDSVMDEVGKRIAQIDGVQNSISISGFSAMGGSGSNFGSLFVTLKPWADRKAKSEHVQAIINKMEMACADIQEAIIFGINPPSIPGLGMTSGLQMQLLDINNHGPQEIKTAIDDVVAAARKDPSFASVTTLYQGVVPQYKLTVDRDRAKMYGLEMADVYTTLGSYMGSAYINDFNEFGRTYQVLVTARGSDRAEPKDILSLTARSNDGHMVPFAAFAELSPSMGPANVERYDMYTTASLTASPAHGVSSSEAIARLEQIVEETLGHEYGYSWTGEAYQETQGGTTITMVLIFAIVITILVLAAQYESVTDPIAVVISMPTAILGTVIGCLFMGQSISIYTQIGIILLLGLSAKNAILIVEYAVDFRKSGLDVRTSAEDAGKIRFRPIIMTALAFVFGVMPMLFATGAGAASRVALGTAVVFGMAINALVGTLFVPNFWELLERFREKYLAGFFNAGSTPAKPEQSGDDAGGSSV